MTGSEDGGPEITVEVVKKMFPATPARNIEANLPLVLEALAGPPAADRSMILMALATIRAETEVFLTPLRLEPER